MTFKELGVTKTKIKPLVQLKLIEERKIKTTPNPPKTSNGAKITEKGIAFVIGISKSGEISPLTQLNKALNEISTLRKGVETQIVETKTTLDALAKIEATLLILNQSVKAGGFEKPTSVIHESKVSIEKLRESYLKHKNKGSPFAPLGRVMEDILEVTELTLSDLKYEVYELFVLKKVLLVGGQSNESNQYKIRADDGTEYAHIRVL
ncbi:MAG: hypothetical protein ACW99Q_18770 [Candidatus Kariarchaeaceae archaeon]